MTTTSNLHALAQARAARAQRVADLGDTADAAAIAKAHSDYQAAVSASPALAADETATPHIFRLDWWQLEQVVPDGNGYRFRDLKPIWVVASLVLEPTPALTVWAVHCDQDTKKNRAVLVYAREGDAEATAERLNEVCTGRRVDSLIVRSSFIPKNLHGVNVPSKLAVGRPVTGLLERAHAVVPLFRDGLVSAPGIIDDQDIVRFIDWADATQIELCVFPHAAKDNITRSAIMGLEYLRDCGAIAWKAS